MVPVLNISQASINEFKMKYHLGLVRISEKHRNEYSNIFIFVKKVLNSEIV